MRRSRGFTLMEMMVVVAIVGIIAAIAIPNLSQTNTLADMRAASRKLLGTLARARILASTGKNEGYAGWSANDRTVEAGIIFSATGYQLFLDNDRSAGGEVILEVVDFSNIASQSNYAPTLSIVSPAPGTQIRFQRNGTLAGAAPADVDIVLREGGSGLSQTIRLAYGGSARIF